MGGGVCVRIPVIVDDTAMMQICITYDWRIFFPFYSWILILDLLRSAEVLPFGELLHRWDMRRHELLAFWDPGQTTWDHAYVRLTKNPIGWTDQTAVIVSLQIETRTKIQKQIQKQKFRLKLKPTLNWNWNLYSNAKVKESQTDTNTKKLMQKIFYWCKNYLIILIQKLLLILKSLKKALIKLKFRLKLIHKPKLLQQSQIET